MLKCSLDKVVVGTNTLGNGGILCGLNLVGGVDAHIVEEQVAASLKTGIAGLLLDGLVLALVDNLYVIIAHQVDGLVGVCIVQTCKHLVSQHDGQAVGGFGTYNGFESLLGLVVIYLLLLGGVVLLLVGGKILCTECILV